MNPFRKKKPARRARATERPSEHCRRLLCESLETRCLLSGTSLGTNALVEGPAAGSDADLVVTIDLPRGFVNAAERTPFAFS